MELKECRVLVTPTSYARHDPRLWDDLRATVGEVIVNPYPRPLTSDELRTLLPGVHGMIAGLDMLDSEALATADQLKVIARYGIGVERVDLEAARTRNIVVCNTPGANAGAVAELTVGFMIALARGIIATNEAMRRGGWPRVSGTSLEGKTVGVLGFGAIGKRVTALARAFGCIVLAYDPFVKPEVMHQNGAEASALDALLGEADFVTLHLPVNEQTRGMVDARFLAKVKPGAFLVNTARGDLLDEQALLNALNRNQLAGVALDAFVHEPPAKDDALATHPKVIATPHIGGNTDSACNAMGWMALQACLAVLRGEQPEVRLA